MAISVQSSKYSEKILRRYVCVFPSSQLFRCKVTAMTELIYVYLYIKARLDVLLEGLDIKSKNYERYFITLDVYRKNLAIRSSYSQSLSDAVSMLYWQSDSIGWWCGESTWLSPFYSWTSWGNLRCYIISPRVPHLRALARITTHEMQMNLFLLSMEAGE